MPLRHLKNACVHRIRSAFKEVYVASMKPPSCVESLTSGARSAWETLHLPVRSTAPATRTKAWFQTGAVKQETEHRQPGGQGLRDQMRIGRRGGAATIRCHRWSMIESHGRRKNRRPTSANATCASRAVHRPQHDRPDHPARRELSLPSGLIAPRASEPRRHTLPRHFRSADCTAPSHRSGRSGRGALLVAEEGTLDQGRLIRPHHRASRPSPQVHRSRGHLLDNPIAVPSRKMWKVQPRVRRTFAKAGNVGLFRTRE